MKLTGCLVIVCLCTIAAAKDRVPDARVAEARARFEKGTTLAKDGRFVEAIAELQAGYDLSKRPLFLFNIAECARQAGDRVRARASYERYLAEDPEGELATKARERLAELGPAAVAPKVEPAPQTAPAVVKVAKPVAKPVPAKVVVVPALPAPVPTTPPVSTPLWKRWPVWVGVGVAVAAGSVAIYAVSRGNDPCGGNCAEVNWR